MSGEKIWIPQIGDDPAALSHARRQATKHVAVCARIEITKTLRHDDRSVERVALGQIIPNVRARIAWPTSKCACFRDDIKIAINADNGVTLAGKRARVVSHPTADISKFAEIR